MIQRRSFLLGLTGALAAPAVVRAESLMKLWVPPKRELAWAADFSTEAMRLAITERWSFDHDMWRRVYFDEASQKVMSEQVFAETPFVRVPSGDFWLPTNAVPGLTITVKA